MKKIGWLLAAAAVALVLGAVSGPSLAWAANTSGARIAKPGTTEPLLEGGSATKFSVVLPVGAHCPGDTPHDGFRVWSYLVPGGVDLRTVSLAGLIPQPGYPLKANGDPFGPTNTEEHSGQITRLPNNFTFADLDLTASDLQLGASNPTTWHVGIACADVRGAMSTYWDAELAFTADATDPAGYSWTVSDTTAPPRRAGSTTKVFLIAGVGFAAVAVWQRARLRARKRAVLTR